MHRLLPLIAVLLGSVAQAAPTVVWLEPEVPDETARKKVERLLELEATHISHPELAFPPAPLTDEDAADYERLADLMLEARTRWNEYEVEYGLAEDLSGALRQIDVLRDGKDLRAVVDANLVIGAAMAMATTPEELRGAARAEPYRVTLSGVPMSRGWVQASALDPDREVVRADLVDGSRYPQYTEFASSYGQLPEGSIDLTAAPRGTVVMVDGEPVEPGTAEVFAPAGMHYVHLDMDGKVIGRMTVDVAPQKVAALPLAVSLPDLGQARSALLEGSTEFPKAVSEALEGLATDRTLYVAAVDDGKVSLEPWTGNAAKAKRRPVTVVAAGELGAGVVMSTIFEGSDGEKETVLAGNGSLGFEVGIYNFAILFGSDVAITPGRVILYGNSDMTANEATSVLPMPYGGFGAYVMRPRGRNATLLLAGTYGWQGPAHWGLGGRVALGIPTGETSWVRLSLGGTHAGKSAWDEALGQTIPLQSLYFRIGIGARL
ncbi:MAG: hypothetical protein EP330_07510 [Deltaproteobacteria bacterium]|nr:MAG: hypothetical protein EP330_07510 [Deltaproteobacteria bacterium]